MAKNWEKVASTVWPVLVRMAKDHAEPCSYDDLARKIKTTEAKLTCRNIHNALAPIQNYCLDNGYPLLTALVVRRVNRKLTIPGSGFAWKHVVDGWEEERNRVWKFPKWEKEVAEKSFLSTYTIESLAKKLIEIEDAEKAKEIYASVRSRGDKQRIFRRGLLKIYNRQCAMCGLGFVEVLEAAHIIPWSQSKDFLLTNGILLCANHHKFFDSGIISMTRNYKIKCNKRKLKFQKHRYSDSDKQALLNLHGKSLRLPKNEKYYPDKKWLAKKGRL